MTELQSIDDTYKITQNPLNTMPISINQYTRILPIEWKQFGDGIQNLKPRPDDVFVMTLPRSGTTLVQEMVWILINDLDFENSNKYELEQRSPILELSLFSKSWKEYTNRIAIKCPNNPKVFESVVCDTQNPSYEEFDKIPGPRTIKTHLPLSCFNNILESSAKIVYIARDPRDQILSLWRFLNAGVSPMWKSNIEEFWYAFKNNLVLYGPSWPHIKEAWNLRHHPNILFLFYEDLRANLPASVKKVATFLGKTYTDEEISKVACHLSIDNFRKNPMVNLLKPLPSVQSVFIGQGKVGGFKEVIPDHIVAEIDEWIAENLKDTDIPFPSIKKKELNNHH